MDFSKFKAEKNNEQQINLLFNLLNKIADKEYPEHISYNEKFKEILSLLNDNSVLKELSDKQIKAIKDIKIPEIKDINMSKTEDLLYNIEKALNKKSFVDLKVHSFLTDIIKYIKQIKIPETFKQDTKQHKQVVDTLGDIIEAVKKIKTSVISGGGGGGGGSFDKTGLSTEAKQNTLIAEVSPTTDNPKTFEDTSFVTGESPAVLDCNTALGRNAKKGYIVNDGAGDFTVSFSNDGTVFGDEMTIKADETLSFSSQSVDSIRITWIADSAYRVSVI